MLPYGYVRKEWIVSPTARLVYRAAATVSLTLYLSLALVACNEPTSMVRPLLFIGVLATALNVVGMEYFLFRFDDSPALKQVFWFCVMIFAPLGPALYCFVVYSRSGPVRSNGVAGRQHAGES
jgi:hypothetical protein